MVKGDQVEVAGRTRKAQRCEVSAPEGVSGECKCVCAAAGVGVTLGGVF